MSSVSWSVMAPSAPIQCSRIFGQWPQCISRQAVITEVNQTEGANAQSTPLPLGTFFQEHSGIRTGWLGRGDQLSLLSPFSLRIGPEQGLAPLWWMWSALAVNQYEAGPPRGFP